MRLQDELRAEAARLRDSSAFTTRVDMKLQYLREASLLERAAAALDVCSYVEAGVDRPHRVTRLG